MKSLTKTIFAASICLLTAAPVYAHNDWNGGPKDRLERQHERIEHGIDNGQLTRKEAKVLKREQRRSRHLFRDFHADGHLSKRERHKLNRHLDRVSDRIWVLKHNERSRHHKPDYRYDYEWRDDHRRNRHHRQDSW